jgi:glycosyltransferase involved in cell wall biosynthesis
MSLHARSLLVQGWTGINHSYAMVNQYQLLEFLKMDRVNIFHSEAPYYNSAWSRENIGAGFAASDAQLLAEIAPYQGESVHAIYRIHTPNTLALADVPVITFLVTEFGLDNKNFVHTANLDAYVGAGNKVVTPSVWSQHRIIEYGFPADSVYVIPHGVDSARFFPQSDEDRFAARAALGYSEEHVVLLNVGAPLWNKGMDLVFESFFKARQRNKNLRLLIKDQQALYGMTAVKMLQTMVAQGRVVIDDDSIAAISVIPGTLSLGQLRNLYCVADYYLSPYRAEGFNLPVIEAIACGTPVIVTAGGSTDDFCDSNVAIHIPSTLSTNTVYGGHAIGASLAPDMGALAEILGACARGEVALRQRMPFGRADVLETFTWKRAATLLAALL